MAVDNKIMDEFELASDQKSKKARFDSAEARRVKKVVRLDSSRGGVKPAVKKVELVEKSVKSGSASGGKPASLKKEDNFLFTLVIVAVVILGIIGIVFGYTKDKLAELKTGGNDVTKGLEQQVADLKQQVSSITEKADNLEKNNLNNTEVVLDLFEKARKIPSGIDTTDWTKITDPALSFTLFYPNTWEAVRPLAPAPAADGTVAKTEQIVYLQPIGKSDFSNAVTVKNDYTDFAAMTLKEKLVVFKDLELIDSATFKGGEMLYFLNIDKDKNVTPTILILTDKNIYRATFNIADKRLDGYFEYRKNFEEIVSTFALAALPEKPATPAATPKK